MERWIRSTQERNQNQAPSLWERIFYAASQKSPYSLTTENLQHPDDRHEIFQRFPSLLKTCSSLVDSKLVLFISFLYSLLQNII